MSEIMNRLKNAYDTGGLVEIGRKMIFREVYRYHGRKIYRCVLNREMEYGLCKDSKRGYQVIVSLTTFPSRFPYIDLCLKSLILQFEKPDRIIVYLGSDVENGELPEHMKRFEKYGVEFRHDKEKNLKSHKKYFYAMQEFPEAVVVTADDDIVYPSDWLRSLLDSYEKYPNAISARRVHLIRKTKQNMLESYNHWFDQYRRLREPSHTLLATGNAGILYPPHCLDTRAFNVKEIIDICYDADDIWLKCMAILCNTKVVWVPNNAVDLPEIKGMNQTVTLSDSNVGASKNDFYLKQVMEHYHIDSENFFKK